MLIKSTRRFISFLVLATSFVGGTWHAANAQRAMSDWTSENPATFEEIEAELAKHSGEKFILMSTGGAWSATVRKAWLQPLIDKFVE